MAGVADYLGFMGNLAQGFDTGVWPGENPSPSTDPNNSAGFFDSLGIFEANNNDAFNSTLTGYNSLNSMVKATYATNAIINPNEDLSQSAESGTQNAGDAVAEVAGNTASNYLSKLTPYIIVAILVILALVILK